MPRLTRTRSASKLASDYDVAYDLKVTIPQHLTAYSTVLPGIDQPFHVSGADDSTLPQRLLRYPVSPDPRRKTPLDLPAIDSSRQPACRMQRDSYQSVNQNITHLAPSVTRQHSERLRPKPTPLHGVVVTSSMIFSGFTPPIAHAISRPTQIHSTINDARSPETMTSPPIIHSEHSFRRESERFIEAQNANIASVRP